METSVTDYQIISKPNNSLTASQRVKLVAVLAIIPLLVAVGFVLAGMWMVLPFFGLELLALGYAFYYVNCHAGDYESIRIEDGCLVVERRNLNYTSRDMLNPYWVQVVMQDQPSRELRLYLRSHGKELEIGRYMTSEQRAGLGAQLRKRTGQAPKEN